MELDNPSLREKREHGNIETVLPMSRNPSKLSQHSSGSTDRLLGTPPAVGSRATRNHSYFSNASKNRQELAKRGSANKLALSRSNSIVQSSSRDNLAGLALAIAAATANLALTSANSESALQAESLRRILEDYLEIDSKASSNPRFAKLLNGEVLSRYFQRIQVPSREVLFDVDQLADKVSKNCASIHMSIMIV